MFTTSTPISSTPAAPFVATFRAVAKVVNLAARVIKAWLRRREIMTLTEWDDHMLRDIGITRGDLHAAFASPAATDPSLRLSVMAVERRAANRAQAEERLAALAEMRATQPQNAPSASLVSPWR